MTTYARSLTGITQRVYRQKRMNRIDRKFINWIFESTILVIAAALVGAALDRVFNTRAQFLGLFLLAALVIKAWQLVRLYRKSMADPGDKDQGGKDNRQGPPGDTGTP